MESRSIIDLAKNGKLMGALRSGGFLVDLEKLEIIEDFLENGDSNEEVVYAFVNIMNSIIMKIYNDNKIEHGKSVFDISELGDFHVE